MLKPSGTRRVNVERIDHVSNHCFVPRPYRIYNHGYHHWLGASERLGTRLVSAMELVPGGKYMCKRIQFAGRGLCTAVKAIEVSRNALLYYDLQQGDEWILPAVLSYGCSWPVSTTT